MSGHTEQVIEVALVVTVTSEVQAAAVAEVLARNMVGLTDDDVSAHLHIERFEQVCHHHEAEQ